MNSTAPLVNDTTGDLDRITTDLQGDSIHSNEAAHLERIIENMHATRAEIFANAGMKGRAITLPYHFRITNRNARLAGVVGGLTGVCTWDGDDWPTIFNPNGPGKIPNPNKDTRTLQITFDHYLQPNGRPAAVRVAFDDIARLELILGKVEPSASVTAFDDNLHNLEQRLEALYETRADAKDMS